MHLDEEMIKKYAVLLEDCRVQRKVFIQKSTCVHKSLHISHVIAMPAVVPLVQNAVMVHWMAGGLGTPVLPSHSACCLRPSNVGDGLVAADEALARTCCVM